MQQTVTEATPVHTEYGGVLRRIGAFTYDILLLLALLFVATSVLMPFTHDAVHSGNPLYQVYLCLITYFFYGWFWTHGGQTLGMRAWKIRVERLDGSDLDWKTASVRFALGFLLFGIGLLWCPFDPQKRALYDKLARTQVIRVQPKYIPKIS
jgi:uncharacterized RDD family membrane protein YckC